MKKLNISIYFLFLIIFLIPVNVYAADKTLTIDNYINDHADVIDDDIEKELNELGAQFEEQTGSQVIFITEDSLDGQDIRQVAYQTFKEYQLGDEQLDNGILFIASIDDRLRYMEVGRGLEGVMTDITSQHLQTDYLVPYFQEGDYSTGIEKLYIETINTIQEGIDEGLLDTPSSSTDQTHSQINWWVLIPISMILVILMIYAFRTKVRPASTIYMQPGEKKQLDVDGFDFQNESILISSQDSSIVSVTPSGQIVAHQIGSAKIYLQKANQHKKTYIKVVVSTANNSRSSRKDDELFNLLFLGSLLSSGRRSHGPYNHRHFGGSNGFGGFHGGGGGSSRGGGAGGSW